MQPSLPSFLRCALQRASRLSALVQYKLKARLYATTDSVEFLQRAPRDTLPGLVQRAARLHMLEVALPHLLPPTPRQDCCNPTARLDLHEHILATCRVCSGCAKAHSHKQRSLTPWATSRWRLQA
jgi:hypothetical protein